jgi:hypothetical protein
MEESRNSIYSTSLSFSATIESPQSLSHRFWVCTSLSFSATIAAGNILICSRCSGIKKFNLQNKSDQTDGDRGTAEDCTRWPGDGSDWARDGSGLGEGRHRTGRDGRSMAEDWARAGAGPDLSGAESGGCSFWLVFVISVFYEGVFR